jgi:hypothetical protein
LYCDPQAAREQRDCDASGQYIPNALEQVASLGAELNRSTGWFGGARIRYFGASPVSQDNAIRSRPSLQVSRRSR